jgi:hypothetical protein
MGTSGTRLQATVDGHRKLMGEGRGLKRASGARLATSQPGVFTVRKMILMALASFFWKKFQGRRSTRTSTMRAPTSRRY